MARLILTLREQIPELARRLVADAGADPRPRGRSDTELAGEHDDIVRGVPRGTHEGIEPRIAGAGFDQQAIHDRIAVDHSREGLLGQAPAGHRLAVRAEQIDVEHGQDAQVPQLRPAAPPLVTGIRRQEVRGLGNGLAARGLRLIAVEPAMSRIAAKQFDDGRGRSAA